MSVNQSLKASDVTANVVYLDGRTKGVKVTVAAVKIGDKLLANARLTFQYTAPQVLAELKRNPKTFTFVNGGKEILKGVGFLPSVRKAA